VTGEVRELVEFSKGRKYRSFGETTVSFPSSTFASYRVSRPSSSSVGYYVPFLVTRYELSTSNSALKKLNHEDTVEALNEVLVSKQANANSRRYEEEKRKRIAKIQVDDLLEQINKY